MASPEQPTVAPPADIGAVNVVETPTSPSSAFTLSRFEFEAGTKGNEGTKILMVEWDARAATDAASSANPSMPASAAISTGMGASFGAYPGSATFSG